jgi:hypothetical protein
MSGGRGSGCFGGVAAAAAAGRDDVGVRLVWIGGGGLLPARGARVRSMVVVDWGREAMIRLRSLGGKRVE